MPFKDPKKAKQWQIEYNNRPEVKERKRQKIIKNKLKAIEYTGGIQCHSPFCSWNNELQLEQIDFHHVIKEKKTKDFCALMKGKWKRLKEEIDRCEAIPLCANCHRVITFS